MFEQKKICPVCGELVAVWQGDANKYGDKAEWNWHRFIRLKYDCQECRDIMSKQQKRLSDKRCQQQWREQRTSLLDLVGAYREEVRAYREEIRLSRKYIAELEAARRC